jgi:AbrB family looped-hinge helix DNA binding protein
VIEISVKIGSKNQITLPAEVRRRLGVGPADTIAFVFADDGTVQLRRAKFELASIIGSIPSLPDESLDLERVIADATAEAMQRVTGANGGASDHS